MEEWWAVANGPALWISGFVLGGLAIVGAIFMQIQAINEGKKIGFGKDKVNEVRKSTLITSIGPGLGITFGMIPLMIALSPGVAWLRESAGVGSIMYELITASQGAQAAGMELGPGMTIKVFASALFIMSIACIPWLIMTMVYTPIAKPMADKAQKLDPKMLPLIITGLMLVVFGDGVASRTLPLFGPQFTAALISAVCTLVVFITANKLKKPHLKEYSLVIAMLVGMFGAYAIFGG
jgi:hypothetical protein